LPFWKGYHDEAVDKRGYVERQIQQVAVKSSSLDPDYKFGMEGWINRPRIRRMTWLFFNCYEITTFYGGLIIILLVAFLIYSAWIPSSS
jgi:hypothetical protein